MSSMTAFERHLLAIRAFPLLSPERERELSKIINGKLSAGEKDKAVGELVGSNTRLVIDLAKNFSRWGELEDLVADGNHGLVVAAQRFDYRKKVRGKGRFSTYAGYYIRCYIMRGIRLRSRAGVHVPPNIFSNMGPVLRALAENPDMGIRELMKRTGLSRVEILSTKRALAVSVVEYMGSEIDGKEYSFPIDAGQPDPSDLVHISQLLKLVMATAKELGYGPEEVGLLAATKDDTSILDGLAKRKGVSKSRIRMLKKEIMWRIRKKLRSKIGKEEFQLFFPGFLHPNSWRHNPIPCKSSQDSF